MQLEADMPYPSLQEITKDMESLKIISSSYAGRHGELTAILLYVYQSILFEEWGQSEIAETLISIAVCEMHHLELLGSAIMKLGAPPIYTSYPPYPVGFYSANHINYNKNPRQMICIDICGEENSITEYDNMLCSLKNPVVATLISRIIEDEKLHLKALREILDKFY